jgi:hypothetical protein
VEYALRLIAKENIQERFANSNATVVLDESELAKSIHEFVYARSGTADHICEGFL